MIYHVLAMHLMFVGVSRVGQDPCRKVRREAEEVLTRCRNRKGFDITADGDVCRERYERTRGRWGHLPCTIYIRHYSFRQVLRLPKVGV